MEKSTLVEILRTFSKDELSGFGDFVSSPYFNKKSNVTKLYTALKKLAPDFPAAMIAKEEMWKSIFPGKKYNYGIMKNLIYDLNKLAVKFLELEVYSQKQFDNDFNQLDAFRLKKLKSLFIKKSAESRKNLAAQPLASEGALLYVFRVSCDWCSRNRLSINSAASQSRSSGCVGRSPWTPKSLGVATIPRPRWCCQRRFTITRASRCPAPCSGSVIQFASDRRR